MTFWRDGAEEEEEEEEEEDTCDTFSPFLRSQAQLKHAPPTASVPIAELDRAGEQVLKTSCSASD